MMRSDSVLGRGKNDDIDGAMATHKDERNGTIEDLREQHTRLQQELCRCERETRIAEADLATYSDTHDLPDHTVWLLCVRKRDEVTKTRWKESFEKRPQTSGTINDATMSNTSSAHTKCDVKYFMTSASEYQNLKFGRPCEFRDEEDTGIPALRRACYGLPEEVRQKYKFEEAIQTSQQDADRGFLTPWLTHRLLMRSAQC